MHADTRVCMVQMFMSNAVVWTWHKLVIYVYVFQKRTYTYVKGIHICHVPCIYRYVPAGGTSITNRVQGRPGHSVQPRIRPMDCWTFI